jgi:starch phosphorylase
MFYDAGPDGLPRRWLEMVGHTLRALGPRVQASRMVREYATQLYLPAARASRALTGSSVTAAGGPVAAAGAFAAASELATWKRRVSRAWSEVAIEHVEALDGDQIPGGKLVIRASVRLGTLTPDDVAVEAVYGRLGDEDEILSPDCNALALAEAPGEDGVARYEGEAELGRPGPFGYTVRVVPRHHLLASSAELGLVTLPEVPAGMTTGDLR